MIRSSGYIYLRKRKKKIYYIAYTDVTGNTIRESSGSAKKQDARRLLDQRIEIVNNARYGFKETNASYIQHFKDFLNLYKEGTQTHKSYKGVLKLFVEFLGDKYPALQYLHQFTSNPKIFDDYKIWLKKTKFTPEGKPHKDWTIKNHLKVLKTVFIQAKDWRHILEMPSINSNVVIEDRKPIVALKKESDFTLFFERCKKIRPEYYPAYFVTVRTGMRFGEMCNLIWDDVNLKDGYITIKPHKDFIPKGRRKKSGLPKERTIPLTKDAIKALETIPRSEKHDNVFLRNGEPIDKRDKSFRRWILAIVKGTRLAGMTRFHELRHTTGHILAEQGTSRDTIADILGHSDIRTTEIYVGKPEKPKMDAIKKLDGFGIK